MPAPLAHVARAALPRPAPVGRRRNKPPTPPPREATRRNKQIRRNNESIRRRAVKQPWATSTRKIGCSSPHRARRPLRGLQKEEDYWTDWCFTVGLLCFVFYLTRQLREMGFYSTRCSYYRTCRRKGLLATGKKLLKDVLRLKMAKNQDNQWHCL